MTPLSRATGLLALLLLAACASTPPAASAPAASLLHSKEGGFSVEVPGAVTSGQRAQPTGLGDLRLHTFVATDATDGAAYYVSYTDFPDDSILPTSARELLRQVSRATVASWRGTRVTSRELLLDGFPGEEVGAVVGTSALVARFYLVGPRLYQQILVYPREQMPAEAERFFTSFRLDPTVAAGLAEWRQR